MTTEQEQRHRRGFDGANLWYGKRGTITPAIPTPDKKEHPVVEELVEKPEDIKHAEEQAAKISGVDVKPLDYFYHPEYNILYGSLRTEGGWRYTVDNIATGNVTTIAGATVTSAVSLAIAPFTRISQWPGAVQAYLVVRHFCVAPSTATFTTAGELEIQYVDSIGGFIIPMADIINNQSFNSLDNSILIPTPITDPSVKAIGTLNFTLSSGATVGTYLWQMGFAYAYLLPAPEPKQGARPRSTDIHVKSNHH